MPAAHIKLAASVRSRRHDWSKDFHRLSCCVVASVMALGLVSCVASESPLLVGAKPTLGDQFTVQLYRHFTEGKAQEAQTSIFAWKNGAYLNVGGSATDLSQFVALPLQAQDMILQGTRPGKHLFTYWIGRKLANGTYLIVPLDEADVSAKDRAAFCAKQQPIEFCLIKTFDQLQILAHATAQGPGRNTEIGIITRDGLTTTSDAQAVQ